MLVFIGTQDKAIHAALLSRRSGVLEPLGPVAEVERPTFVLADPVRSALHCVSEMGNRGECIGSVHSFAVDRSTGELSPLGHTPSGGGGPTHLCAATDGGALFIANFGGGEVASLALNDTGAPNPVASVRINHGNGPHRRQQGPHAHGVTLSPDGRHLLAPDMGADRVFVYPMEADGLTLAPALPTDALVPPGAGPRLILFGADGRFAYLLTELSAHIVTCAWHAETGALSALDDIALDPTDVTEGTSAAGFAISGDGAFLYASNRRTHAIHVFAIDGETGRLKPLQTVPSGGEKPWAIEITPCGGWLLAANQASDRIALFRRDPKSGRLGSLCSDMTVPSPTGLAFFMP